MRWRLWKTPTLLLLGGLLLAFLVIFAPLDDGSYECPGNAITLTRNPLPEDDPPPDGFHAEAACRQTARERLGLVVPWIAGLTAAAVVVSFGIGLHGARKSA